MRVGASYSLTQTCHLDSNGGTDDPVSGQYHSIPIITSDPQWIGGGARLFDLSCSPFRELYDFSKVSDPGISAHLRLTSLLSRFAYVRFAGISVTVTRIPTAELSFDYYGSSVPASGAVLRETSKLPDYMARVPTMIAWSNHYKANVQYDDYIREQTAQGNGDLAFQYLAARGTMRRIFDNQSVTIRCRPISFSRVTGNVIVQDGVPNPNPVVSSFHLGRAVKGCGWFSCKALMETPTYRTRYQFPGPDVMVVQPPLRIHTSTYSGATDNSICRWEFRLTAVYKYEFAYPYPTTPVRMPYALGYTPPTMFETVPFTDLHTVPQIGWWSQPCPPCPPVEMALKRPRPLTGPQPEDPVVEEPAEPTV